MEKETYTLAPATIVHKARRLADVGLYQQALALLRRHCVEADVYPTHVEMRLPRLPTNRGGFQKGNTLGSLTNKLGRRKKPIINPQPGARLAK